MNVDALTAAIQTRSLRAEGGTEPARRRVRVRLWKALGDSGRGSESKSEPTRTHASDADLLRRLRAGNPLAMTALYERYSGQLLGYAARQLDLPDAEEAVLDAFLRLCRYDGKIQSARGYLYMVLRGKIIDIQRKQLPKLADGAPETAHDPTVLGDLIRQQERDALERAMERLPAIQQEAVLLYLQDLPGKVIAARLGVSEASGRALLSRARKALRRILSEDVA